MVGVGKSYQLCRFDLGFLNIVYYLHNTSEVGLFLYISWPLRCLQDSVSALRTLGNTASDIGLEGLRTLSTTANDLSATITSDLGDHGEKLRRVLAKPQKKGEDGEDMEYIGV
jgi:hypothetical protein